MSREREREREIAAMRAFLTLLVLYRSKTGLWTVILLDSARPSVSNAVIQIFVSGPYLIQGQVNS